MAIQSGGSWVPAYESPVGQEGEEQEEYRDRGEEEQPQQQPGYSEEHWGDNRQEDRQQEPEADWTSNNKCLLYMETGLISDMVCALHCVRGAAFPLPLLSLLDLKNKTQWPCLGPPFFI